MTVSTPPEPVGAIDDFVAKFERCMSTASNPICMNFCPRRDTRYSSESFVN